MSDLFRFTAPTDGRLTPDMKSAYADAGVLVLEDYLTKDETARMRDATAALVEEFDPETVRTVFSTDDQKHAADTYFRESGDKVRYFFEAGALDETGSLVRDKTRALNKIGHALHDLDPDFAALSRLEKLERTVRDCGLSDPGLIQSMVIFKQPHIGGEVGMHQDSTFLHTEPLSCTGFWFALEDATQDNGCLFGLPGLKDRTLAQRFHYDGDDLTMSPVAPTPMPMEDAVALEAPEGTLVVLHGLFPHASHPNLSNKSRQAYALHMIDRATAWSKDNWLKRAMPITGFETRPSA
ncbi:MAG: phytanoyl-CoA dioxygenase family protein [Pseudomonadota bacterium]